METDGFQRKGQAWFCTTGLPSDITFEVGEMLFHLHKFPLMSRSGMLTRLVAHAERNNDHEEETVCAFVLQDVPGGAESFELVAKFCYGVNLELTAANVAALRCAAEYLEMTEEYGEENLIKKTQNFIQQVVLSSWKDSVRVLQSCEGLMPQAEELQIVKDCVDSLATKACSDSSLSGWPILEQGLIQSPEANAVLNDITAMNRLRNARFEWWYEDLALLGLPLYKLVIAAMKAKGLQSEIIAGALMHYAKKSVPGLNRRQGGHDNSFPVMMSLSSAPSETDQRLVLEMIESLLPSSKGAASTSFLLACLKTGLILNASQECKHNLERRIGAQLEQASLDDLLIPNYSYTLETLYDMDCIQRILEHFLLFDEMHETETPHSFDESLIGSPSSSPMVAVAKLLDAYLQEVAPDANLKPAKFEALAGALPDYARVTDDGLYRAIDIYLKAHPWLTEQERETISSIMNCHKLSLEACSHAAQNSRLPLRVAVKVLFVEQLQLRSAITGSLFANDSTDLMHSHSHHAAAAGRGSRLDHQQAGQDQEKAQVDQMRLRLAQLEDQCSNMRVEIRRLRRTRGVSVISGSSWSNLAKKLGCKNAFRVCDSQEKLHDHHQGLPPPAGAAADTGAEHKQHPHGHNHRGRHHHHS